MPDSETQDLTQRQKDVFKSAGSYQQEIQDDITGDALGEKSPPTPSREGSLGRKDSTDAVGTNPKRTENSRQN